MHELVPNGFPPSCSITNKVETLRCKEFGDTLTDEKENLRDLVTMST